MIARPDGKPVTAGTLALPAPGRALKIARTIGIEARKSRLNPVCEGRRVCQRATPNGQFLLECTHHEMRTRIGRLEPRRQGRIKAETAIMRQDFQHKDRLPVRPSGLRQARLDQPRRDAMSAPLLEIPRQGQAPGRGTALSCGIKNMPGDAARRFRDQRNGDVLRRPQLVHEVGLGRRRNEARCKAGSHRGHGSFGPHHAFCQCGIRASWPDCTAASFRGQPGDARSLTLSLLSWPQAAMMSRPRGVRTGLA